VSATPISALARVAERRFQSFSDAADSVLDVLEGALPAAKTVLAELDREDGSYRVIDVRGEPFEHIERGSSLPWVQRPAAGRNGGGNGQPGGGMLDPEFLRALEVKSYLAVPLATSDGSNLGTLCAVGTESGLFDQSHVELLTLSGRLLTYEWESVRHRADLRRLEEQLRDPERTDPVTGLANRTSFVASTDREWRLSQRGTVTSWLLVCEVQGLAAVRDSYGAAMAELILKDLSEALGATIRRTDHLGRVGETTFATVLVGCKGPEGAQAFFERFKVAFGRVAGTRPVDVGASYGAVALAESESPDAALEAAAKIAHSEEDGKTTHAGAAASAAHVGGG
jgi:diguanylate cyclase (GGDEF)-like protein